MSAVLRSVRRLVATASIGFLPFVVPLTAHAVPGVDPTENTVLQWNDATLQAVKDTRMAPPIASRAFGIVNTCTFDAWAAFDDRARGTRLGKNLRATDRSDAAKREAIAFAAYRANLDLFPAEAQQTYFRTLMTEQGYNPDNSSEDTTTAAGIGNRACAAVLSYRAADGSNQKGEKNSGAPYSDWTNYQPVNTPDQVNDPGRWQPLRLPNGTVQSFLVPHWGRVTPFSLKNPNKDVVEPVRQAIKKQTGRVGPAKFGQDMFYRQAAEVLAYSTVLRDNQKCIAEYWADGPGSETPPGHWMVLSQAVSHRDGHTLDDDTKLFFILGNTLMDTGITIWGAKVRFDSVRPITAIRHLYNNLPVQAWGGAGLGTQTMNGQLWHPYQASGFVTPPFGEYPSGHSAFSSSAAEVLKRFTGSDVMSAEHNLVAGSSRIEPGVVPASNVMLSWATFTDAADEAGMSRRYGGIHFADGDLDSRAMGRRVAALAWRRAQAYITGR